MATKITSKVYGRHTIELWDRENGEYVIRETVQPKQNSTSCHNMAREYSWVYYDLRTAQETFSRECSSVNRGYVCLCPN